MWREKSYRTPKDILTSMVTVKLNETGWVNGTYIQEDRMLGTMLNPKEWEARCNEVAEAPYHSDLQKRLKSAMPRFYIAGTFPKYAIRDKDVVTWSNLVCIDIDGKDNPGKELGKIREQLFAEEYVFAVYLSASRKGLYAIVPVSDGKETKAYCRYLRALWKQKFGIETDSNSENIARARIISYDTDWIEWTKKDDVRVWDLKDDEEDVDEFVKKTEEAVGIFQKDFSSFNPVERTHLAMQRLVTNGFTVDGYNRWLRIACEMRNFADGFDLWYTMTVNNTKYHDFDRQKLLRKYNGLPMAELDENTHRKWQGIAKQQLGENWWCV